MVTSLESRYVGVGVPLSVLVLVLIVAVGVLVGLVALVHASRKQRGS